MENNSIRLMAERLLKVLLALVVVACLVYVFASCESFTEVELPKDQLTTNAVFEDKATADAAMLSFFAKMRDIGLFSGSQSGSAPYYLANYADEMDFYGDALGATTFFYNNALIAANTEVKTIWDASYNQVYAANAVLEGVGASVSLAQADRNRLTGEALFARALIHFTLANVFGDVPYVKVTDYNVTRSVPRMPVQEVYANCVQDLLASAELLQDSYLPANRTRPNKFAARAVLARVYLYAGLYNEASNEASAVINNVALYSNAANLSQTFLADSPATIWQLSPSTPGGNTQEALTYVFDFGPPTLSGLRQDFMEGFEAGDQRLPNWTRAVTDGTTTWYHPYKYKVNTDTGMAQENSIMLRLPEMYLIRAEARAHTSDFIGTQDDLNVIRNLAGLGNTTANTQEALLLAVLQERRSEFFTELGHRFFDLKRLGAVQQRLGSVKPGWDSHDVVFPIPEKELELNPNLSPQNPGY